MSEQPSTATSRPGPRPARGAAPRGPLPGLPVREAFDGSPPEEGPDVDGSVGTQSGLTPADALEGTPIQRLERTSERDLDAVLERGDDVHRSLQERLRDLDT